MGRGWGPRGIEAEDGRSATFSADFQQILSRSASSAPSCTSRRTHSASTSGPEQEIASRLSETASSMRIGAVKAKGGTHVRPRQPRRASSSPASRHRRGGRASRRQRTPCPSSCHRAPHPLRQVGASPAVRPRRDRRLARRRSTTPSLTTTSARPGPVRCGPVPPAGPGRPFGGGQHEEP